MASFDRQSDPPGPGHRLGVGDLLIAAVAAERNALVWSLDRDFERLERLKFVSLYEPATAARRP